ncbi:MAG: hypothetical protein KC496_03070, partial [Anaerolineae bacterium]|nr:hypothetical protein [Anaerolineae bacterium]
GVSPSDAAKPKIIMGMYCNVASMRGSITMHILNAQGQAAKWKSLQQQIFSTHGTPYIPVQFPLAL